MNEKKKLRRLPKRILSFVLTLAMVVTLMPRHGIVAHAASLTTTFDSNKSAEELIGSLLGDGLTVTSVTASGSVNGFSNGMDELGIDRGISLDTSDAANGTVDPDLKNLIEHGGHDYNNGSASTVSFELVATGSLLNFNYVFASCEFDQSDTYNDIFGLFVSVNDGPFENIALLDNGKDVSIKNLKNGLASGSNLGSDYYSERAVSFISNNSSGHGVSNVLFAQKAVQKGDKVVIKIAISDVGDDGFDSYVFIEAGSLSFDPPGAKPDYEEELLCDLTPGATYVVTCDGETYEFIADENGAFRLSGTDKNGKSYDFIGKSISIYQKGEGGIPDSDSVDVEISERPTPQDPDVSTNTPSDSDANDVETTTNSIKVKAVDGQEYRIGTDGSWKSPDEDGYVTFSGLNQLTEYTIYTRVKATSSAPASVISDGVPVKTKGMFAPTKTEYNGPYDGLSHELKVDANVEGATVTYSESLNGSYNSETFSFKDSGEHKVYYCISKENYYNAYGILIANISNSEHIFSYSADDNTITAKCTDNNCIYHEDGVSLTLTASSPNYSGSAATITLTGEADWTAAGLTTPAIKHENASGTEITPAPTAVGTYYATITVGTAKAKIQYTIEQAHEADTTKYSHDDTNHWRPCVVTGCTNAEHKYSTAAHSYDSTSHKCVCGKVDPVFHQHVKGTHHAAVAATCNSTGNVEYWDCTGDCGDKLDISGNAIADVTLAIDASNHSGTATWTKTATTHKQTYNCCGAVVVAEANHVSSGAATETKAETCTVCGYEIAPKLKPSNPTPSDPTPAPGKQYEEVAPASNNGKDTTAPKTGDPYDLRAWYLLLIASLGGMLVLGGLKRKDKASK